MFVFVHAWIYAGKPVLSPACHRLQLVFFFFSSFVAKKRHGSKSANPRLAKVFDTVASSKQAAFIPYLTAGYPKKADTVDLLLALQEGGADVIELGIPFTDPQADGATIQGTNQVLVLLLVPSNIFALFLSLFPSLGIAQMRGY